MKILMVHAEYFKHSLEEVKSLTETNSEMHDTLLVNVLVVFITVERDDKNISFLSTKACDEITNLFRRVRASNVALCPYLYLSKRPAPIAETIKVIEMIEKRIKERGIIIHKVPYRVEFLIKPYVHSLSESIKTINVEHTIT